MRKTLNYRNGMLIGLVCAVALSAAIGWAEQNPSKTTNEPVLLDRNARYRLRPGDVMELTFPFTPEFNQTVSVQPDGFINLQGTGDLRVQDKTTGEVITSVRSAYGKILHEPVINIKLTQFEKPYFVMGGEVTRPGKYDYTGDTTVVQAVAIAGGFTDKAKRGEVLLFRRVSDDWAEVKKVNIQKMLKAGDLSEDLHLRPGDMVLISKSSMSKIERYIPIPTVGTYFNPILH